jgi:hypothetical protein
MFSTAENIFDHYLSYYHRPTSTRRDHDIQEKGGKLAVYSEAHLLLTSS